MKKRTYIGVIASLMLLSACNPSEEIAPLGGYTISGTGEKTPLEVSININDSYQSTNTRALNGSFEEGDNLIAYVEQVERTGSEGSYSYTNKIGKKVDFSVNTIQDNGSVKSDDSNTDLNTILYWDDFSSTENDIRDENRFLRVGYGFCFNGVEKDVSSFNAATAKVAWAVEVDQSTADQVNVRKSDLLWAGPQTPIEYKHVVADRQPLPVTYTHAMSKVTIELVLGEGYDVYPAGDANAGKAKAFGDNNTTPTLFANKEVTEADAINQTLKTTVAASDDPGITMYLVEDEKITNGASNKTRVYEAIIAPTVMKAGNKLAEVTVDGNKYDIVLTNAILETKYPAESSNNTWSSKLNSYEVSSGTLAEKEGGYNETDGGISLSGINYRLVVNLLKQRINVEAKITDWSDVHASINGEIKFTTDVKNVSNTTGEIITDGSFDLWRSTSNESHESYDEYSAVDGVNKATTFTYDSENSAWTINETNPKIYWPNGSTNYYFRALATYSESGSTKTLASVNNSFDAIQGTDLVWGTTAAHTGTEADGTTTHNYAEGGPINPRTGNVPLTFYHVMSKITVNLEDENKNATVPDGVDPTNYNSPLNPRIDLTDATIQFTNLATFGTIELSEGSITPASITEGQKLLDVETGYFSKMNNGTATGKTSNVLDEYIVTPQTIGDNAMIIITLKDGTIYKAKLADCIVTSTNDATAHAINSTISEWKRGKSYTYTITLSKDKITFRALVENWDEVEGGGKATLEWD